MSTRIRVCAVQDLQPGARHVVEINASEEVLVLNVKGTVYAISNICPHQGAALERGNVEQAVLYCPLHRWGFTLSSGVCIDDDTLCAHTYAIERRDGHFFVHLP